MRYAACPDVERESDGRREDAELVAASLLPPGDGHPRFFQRGRAGGIAAAEGDAWPGTHHLIAIRKTVSMADPWWTGRIARGTGDTAPARGTHPRVSGEAERAGSARRRGTCGLAHTAGSRSVQPALAGRLRQRRAGGTPQPCSRCGGCARSGPLSGPSRREGGTGVAGREGCLYLG